MKQDTCCNCFVKDVTSVLSGFAFDSKLFNENSEGLPLIRIRDILKGTTKTYYSGDYDDKYLVKKGDYLIGMDGEFNIAKWNASAALLNQRVCRIEFVTSKVVPEYMYYLLKTELKRIEDRTAFVTVKHLSVKDIMSVNLTLPPLETQKKIAEALDKAQELIDKRREQIEKLDEFIKSVFLDMFGDPANNPKKWEVNKLGTICTKITDGTHHSPINSESGDFMYITAKNIKKDRIDLTNITYVSKEVHKEIYKRCNPEKGDILYIKDGVTTGIAQINNLESEFSLLSSVALLKLNTDVLNNYYLREVLNNKSIYNKIRSNMGGAAITRLTLVKINSIEVTIPPLQLQNQFAKIVEKIEQQKELLQKSLTKMENNFNSIMQKAFRGELFTN